MTMLMPGMLTEEQMKQLDAARGPEFDRLFLTFMIQHHQRRRRDGAGAVRHARRRRKTKRCSSSPSDVNVDQTTEIARMLEMMLFALKLAPRT